MFGGRSVGRLSARLGWLADAKEFSGNKGSWKLFCVKFDACIWINALRKEFGCDVGRINCWNCERGSEF